MSDPAPADPLEIELKLGYLATDRAALERMPLLAASEPARQREVTTYFDTSELTLSRQGVSLRVRRTGAARIQTLKSARDGSGVAARRGEWEWPVGQDAPDLDLLQGTALHDPGALAGRLQPIVVTEIERTRSSLAMACGGIVEVAFDEGSVRAGRSSEPIHELELELKRGSVGAVYRLGILLLQSAPLSMATRSKAERGFRLISGDAPRTVKAGKLLLPKDIRAADAFRAMIGAALGHLLANTAAAAEGQAEGIHQVRIALRRLRAALALFDPLLDVATAARFNTALRALGRTLGEGRDWDVFCLETLPEAERAGAAADWISLLRSAGEARQMAAHQHIAARLQDAEFTALVLGLAAWAEDGAGDPLLLGSADLGRRLRKIANRLLHRLDGKARKRGRRAAGGDGASLHALRKSLKKLRYDAEFLSDLYGRRKAKAYRKRCETLQQRLGRVNDAAVTDARLADLTDGNPALTPAAAALTHWNDARRGTALAGLGRDWRRFRRAAAFW